MTKEALPQRAMAALGKHMGITNVESISDIKTSRTGETYYLTVSVTREISQEELAGLVK